MTDLPTEGGTYIRDPKTGQLTRIPDEAPTEPEAPAEPETKPKGGK